MVLKVNFTRWSVSLGNIPRASKFCHWLPIENYEVFTFYSGCTHQTHTHTHTQQKIYEWLFKLWVIIMILKSPLDFPGGSVVKNPPSREGDMGSILGLGWFHLPQSSWVHVPQLLTQLFHLCPRPQEQRLPKPKSSRAHVAQQQEKPPRWDARTLKLDSGLHTVAGEQPLFTPIIEKPAQ